MVDFFLWIKVLHIVGVIAWLAGLLDVLLVCGLICAVYL